MHDVSSAADAADLRGATAVVTGASSGIGRAIARHLGAAGAAVLVHARGRRDLADEVARDIQASGGSSHVLLADFADQADCAVLRAGVGVASGGGYLGE